MYPVFYKINAKCLTIFTQYGIQAPNTTEIKYPTWIPEIKYSWQRDINRYGVLEQLRY